MKKVVLIATVVLKENATPEVLDALRALHSATHQEDEGCLQYDVHQDTERANCYVFVETWQSEALLAAHMEKEHFQTYKALMNDKVKSMSLQKLEKIL